MIKDSVYSVVLGLVISSTLNLIYPPVYSLGKPSSTVKVYPSILHFEPAAIPSKGLPHKLLSDFD